MPAKGATHTRLMTSKQVKRAYQKRGGTVRLTEKERRQQARADELRDRAARIREAEEKRKANRQKREEKERKDREAKERMGIKDSVPKVEEGQLKLAEFLTKGTGGTVEPDMAPPKRKRITEDAARDGDQPLDSKRLKMEHMQTTNEPLDGEEFAFTTQELANLGTSTQIALELGSFAAPRPSTPTTSPAAAPARDDSEPDTLAQHPVVISFTSQDLVGLECFTQIAQEIASSPPPASKQEFRQDTRPPSFPPRTCAGVRAEAETTITTTSFNAEDFASCFPSSNQLAQEISSPETKSRPCRSSQPQKTRFPQRRALQEKTDTNVRTKTADSQRPNEVVKVSPEKVPSSTQRRSQRLQAAKDASLLSSSCNAPTKRRGCDGILLGVEFKSDDFTIEDGEF
ncbi:MAG: hypothetical protein M1825_001184 [Sarcosagium campestre]|nr:MAG: hypothetical protein M1825_001184 [Sarcosagium campestre]